MLELSKLPIKNQKLPQRRLKVAVTSYTAKICITVLESADSIYAIEKACKQLKDVYS